MERYVISILHSDNSGGDLLIEDREAANKVLETLKTRYVGTGTKITSKTQQLRNL